jgi:hypothetical protein
VLLEFGPPLALDVFKRLRRDDGEANQEDIGLRVRERTKSVVIFLAGRIPETQHVGLAVDLREGEREGKEGEGRGKRGKRRRRGKGREEKKKKKRRKRVRHKRRRERRGKRRRKEQQNKTRTNQKKRERKQEQKTDHDVGRVVVEDSGNVFTREGVSGVGNQQTGFTDGTITDDDTFDVLHIAIGRENWREKEKNRERLIFEKEGEVAKNISRKQRTEMKTTQ